MIVIVGILLFVPLVINYFIIRPIMNKMGYPIESDNLAFMLPGINIFISICGLLAGFLMIVLWVLRKMGNDKEDKV